MEKKCMVMVDQTGYLPEAKKIAVINGPAEDFTVLNDAGKVVLQGKAAHFGLDEASGDDVYQADFSELKQVGKYTIRVGGAQNIPTFSIGEDVYKDASDKLLEAFYFLRCGVSLDRERAGKFAHKTCHNKKAVLWDNHKISLDVTGGWHDAGDYGKYVTAGACALSHLLFAYEFFEDSFLEQENGLPKILAECRVELNWLLKMQRTDGAVYHKVTTKVHAPFIMPEEDKEQMYVFSVSTTATADFCAVCAQASRVYQKWDSKFAGKLKVAAECSFAFLQEHPEPILFANPEGNETGDYVETTDRDNRFLACAQMYALTGSEKIHSQLLAFLEEPIDFTNLGCYNMGGLGLVAYLFCKQPQNKKAVEFLSEKLTAEAERLKAVCEKSGYGAAMELWDYSWGSNMNLLKHGMLFALADLWEKDNRFRECALAQWHVLFGVNALGLSYVTGVGEHAYNNPHYRPSYADGIEESVPGLVSGGPNGKPSDEKALKVLAPNTPPMKCYVDDFTCFSLNEVTIYWNSPAVFLEGYLREGLWKK